MVTTANAAKSRYTTMGLVIVSLGLALGGLGTAGVIQGTPTRTVAPWAAVLIALAVLLLGVGMVLLNKAHGVVSKFCIYCGEDIEDDAVTCPACGHAVSA